MTDRLYPLAITGLYQSTGVNEVRDAWIDAIAAVLGDGEYLLTKVIACVRYKAHGLKRKDYAVGEQPKNDIAFSVQLVGATRLSGHTERINALKQLLGQDPLQALEELTEAMQRENKAAKDSIHDLVDKMLLDPSLEDPMFDAIDAARIKASKLLTLNDGLRYLRKVKERNLI